MANNQTLDQQLHQAEVAIDNALANADIQAALVPFGYDAARLAAGRTLYEEALALAQAQKVKYGQQFQATQTLKTAWDTAKTAYKHSLKIARITFKDNPLAAAALMLNGSRKQNLSGWLGQATAFYQNLLDTADLLTAMTAYGYDQAKLEAEAALVMAVETANLAQEREKGIAQEATQARDIKMKELTEWMSAFKAVASVALSDHPQVLEQLGLGPVRA